MGEEGAGRHDGGQPGPVLRTGDHRLVREVNEALVLELLRGQSRSRAALATATGLNKATISKIVDDLIDEGLVREAGTTAHGPGRPARRLEIDPDAGFVVGAELGVDFLNVIITDFAGERLADAQAEVAAEHGPTLAMRSLDRLVDEVIERAGAHSTSVLGMGLSVCGLVDQASGSILFSPNHGWQDVPIRSDLAKDREFPVFIENDAYVSTLGEAVFGAAKGEEDFAMVTGSAGIGVGIVSGGRSVRGASGWAGEFGHMTIVADGPLCRCGDRGCWEALASERALLERYHASVGSTSDRHSEERPLRERWYEIREITRSALGGDEHAASAIRETGRYLGIGLANLVNILNPNLVLIGGGLSLAAELLLPVALEVVERQALHWPAQACRIEGASHGIDTCAMGGVALAVHELFTPSHLRVARPRA